MGWRSGIVLPAGVGSQNCHPLPYFATWASLASGYDWNAGRVHDTTWRWGQPAAFGRIKAKQPWVSCFEVAQVAQVVFGGNLPKEVALEY